MAIAVAAQTIGVSTLEVIVPEPAGARATPDNPIDAFLAALRRDPQSRPQTCNVAVYGAVARKP